MNIEVYVMPESVCFSGIAMEEIPSTTGIHQGYFSNLYFQDLWYHTTDMGAGTWKNIGRDNSWGLDRAWMGEEMPRAEGGMLTISKFTNTVSRSTNNLIRLNGQVVHGIPLTQEEQNEINGSY